MLRCKLHLLVKKLVLNLMLTIRPNLPYRGVKDIGLTKSLKRNLNKHLPSNFKT